LTVPTAPADPDPTKTIALELWKLELKEYRVKEQECSNFQASLYNVVLDQCMEALQDKLKSHMDFPNAYQDGFALLTIIKTLTYTFKERRKLANALCDIKEMFYIFHQGKHTSLKRYHELFLGQVEVLKEVGVMIHFRQVGRCLKW
jgi:SNF2 family DNA or RNA helicase